MIINNEAEIVSQLKARLQKCVPWGRAVLDCAATYGHLKPGDIAGLGNDQLWKLWTATKFAETGTPSLPNPTAEQWPGLRQMTQLLCDRNQTCGIRFEAARAVYRETFKADQVQLPVLLRTLLILEGGRCGTIATKSHLNPLLQWASKPGMDYRTPDSITSALENIRAIIEEWADKVGDVSLGDRACIPWHLCEIIRSKSANTEVSPHESIQGKELATPFNQFFASIEEANWGFNLLQKTLIKLGVDPVSFANDHRACLSLAGERKEGDRLRLNFGNWAILTFQNLSFGDARVQYVCRADRAPSSTSAIDDENRFANEIDGHAFVLASSSVASMRDPASTENQAFTESLAEVAKRFKSWEGGPWAANHQQKVLQMVFDLDLRDRLLQSGLEMSMPSAEVSSGADRSGIAYWWLNANPKIWDFRTAPIGAVQTYTSYNEAGNKRQKYKNFLAVKPGDLVLGYVTSPEKEIVALCQITKGLHTTNEGEVIEFKKIEDFKQPLTWSELQSAPELKHCEPIESNQGSLFTISEDEFEFIRSIIDERNWAALAVNIAPFTKADALDGLFMSEAQLDLTLARLKQKKAVVLQGPPGVGKTFVAKRLAYALMGLKDDRRVSMVQFHPSYGYEDFIQGYRPSRGGGLERRDGVFYEFARQARNEPDHDWFFIIDEINRGNLAKIFGELLMLLESDKRGPDHVVSLTYSEKGEQFYLPMNLHVIGTMNTADRSLAMVDYALRRRFAFVTLEPAVNSKAFGDWLAAAGASNELLDQIRAAVGVLNYAIDKERDLGERFRIGHSFFCPAAGQKPDAQWYREIIYTEIKPLLEEYFDSKDRVENLIEEVLK